MDRRHFLFGTVATAATAAGLLLKAPTDAVALFQPTVGDILAVSRVPKPDVRLHPIDIGETLYTKDGAAVCVVTGLAFRRDRVEVTEPWHNNRVYVPGLPSARLEAELIVPLALTLG